MKLYSRDYCVEPTKSEISEYEEILKEEKANARIGRKILYYSIHSILIWLCIYVIHYSLRKRLIDL